MSLLVECLSDWWELVEAGAGSVGMELHPLASGGIIFGEDKDGYMRVGCCSIVIMHWLLGHYQWIRLSCYSWVFFFYSFFYKFLLQALPSHWIVGNMLRITGGWHSNLWQTSEIELIWTGGHHQYWSVLECHMVKILSFDVTESGRYGSTH